MKSVKIKKGNQFRQMPKKFTLCTNKLYITCVIDANDQINLWGWHEMERTIY